MIRRAVVPREGNPAGEVPPPNPAAGRRERRIRALPLRRHPGAGGGRFLLPLLVLLLLLLPGPGAGAETKMTISFTGDVTLGSVEWGRDGPDAFDAVARREGYEYFFRRVKPLFLADDLTLVNLEVVLSDTARGENTNKSVRLRGLTDYAKILTAGGIEACSIANNHIMDYGQKGYESTLSALRDNGLEVCGNSLFFVFRKEGASAAFFAFTSNTLPTKESLDQVAEQIAELRKEGVGAVICCFHAGQEYNPRRRERDQGRLAKVAVEKWGADLVVMHHPHVLQGIDILRGRYVFYSLGNFCFGGSTVIRSQEGNRSIRSLESVVLQTDLTFDDGGKLLGLEGRLYPCYISSSATEAGDPNDYQPMPVTGSKARGVIARIQEDTAFDLGTMGPGDEYLALPFLAAAEEE